MYKGKHNLKILHKWKNAQSKKKINIYFLSWKQIKLWISIRWKISWKYYERKKSIAMKISRSMNFTWWQISKQMFQGIEKWALAKFSLTTLLHFCCLLTKCYQDTLHLSDSGQLYRMWIVTYACVMVMDVGSGMSTSREAGQARAARTCDSGWSRRWRRRRVNISQDHRKNTCITKTQWLGVDLEQACTQTPNTLYP